MLCSVLANPTMTILPHTNARWCSPCRITGYGPVSHSSYCCEKTQLERTTSDEIMGWRKALVFRGQEQPTFPSFLLSGAASSGVCREDGPCASAPVLEAQGGGGTIGDACTRVSKTAGKMSLRSHL